MANKAAEQARRGALEVGKLYVQLYPCPRCGLRDPAAVARMQKRRNLVLLIAGVTALLGATLMCVQSWIFGATLSLLGVVMTAAGALTMSSALKKSVALVKLVGL